MYLFVQGTNWSEVGSSIARADFRWLVAALCATWLSVLVRGFRWRVLLRGVKSVPVVRLYHMQMIGVMGNGIFPARIGEVARCLLLARLEAISVLSVFASVLAERLLDLVMVGLLLVSAINLFDFPPGQTIKLPGVDAPMAVDAVLGQAGAYLGILFVGLVVGIAILLFVPRIEELVRRVVGLGSRALADIAARWMVSFQGGLAVFRRPSQAFVAFLWTAGVWGSIGLANYFMFPAFGLDIGPLGAVLLTAGLAVSVAIPQAPGFLGVFQLAVTLILVKCFDAPEATAKAVAIVLWVVQLFCMICLGFVSLLLEGVGVSDIWRAKEHAE